MNRANRRDELHSAAGNIFRGAGWFALDLSRVGDGCPDWLLARGAFAFLLEVKSPRKIRKQAEAFTDKQFKFHSTWGGLLHTVESVEEIWKLVELYRQPESGRAV